MKKGFTLIEILVAVTIFSLVVSIASGVFVSAIRSQRKSLASQELLDQTGYVMDYMSRALRMAKKDIDASCISSRLNYEKTREDRGIKFMNYQGICQEFFVQDEQLWEYKKNPSTGEESTLALTSAGLEVASLGFALFGQSQFDELQPRLTIFSIIKGRGLKSEEKPEIKIQTTISQRNLDVKY
ncbi:PilW family protein [Patescibacteria group bacterium]